MFWLDHIQCIIENRKKTFFWLKIDNKLMDHFLGRKRMKKKIWLTFFISLAMQRWEKRNILSEIFLQKTFLFFFQITAPAAVDTWELRLKTETERDLKGICKFTFTKTVDNAKFAVIFVRNKMRVFRYKNFIDNLAERNFEYLEKLWAKTSIYPL